MKMGGGFARCESWEVLKPMTTIWLKWEYAYVFWKVIETHCKQNNNLNYKDFLNGTNPSMHMDVKIHELI